MKNLILSFSMAFLFFTSCSKENEPENIIINSKKIATVVSEKNIDNQKLMYNMLSKEEKFTLWINKLNNISLNPYFNQEQIDLINELKSNLSVDLFDSNPINDKKEVFKAIYVNDFLKKSKNLFNTDEMYLLFFTVNDLKKKNETSKIAGDTTLNSEWDTGIGWGPATNCTCNTTSIWSCAAGIDCIYKKDNCKILASDCGFLTMYECNGKCDLL